MSADVANHAVNNGGFRRDGFDRLPRFAPPTIGQAMLDDAIEVVRAHDRGTPVPEALILPESQADFAQREPEERVSKVFRLHRRPAFAEFIRTDAVLAIVAELIGPDVDCFLSQLIFKNPGAWGQPWHQDSFYFPFEPAGPVVGLWLAITEATLDNGCLHVLRGSHEEPIHEHVPDRRPGANYGYVEIVDHDMSGAEPVLMDPGDLLVFHSHLMHRSTDNRSNGARAAMVFHCCAAGTVDRSIDEFGYASPVNDFVPILRDGVAVPVSIDQLT